MNARSEIVPTEDQIYTLIDKIVAPAVRQIATDTERFLNLAPIVMVGDEPAKPLALLSNGDPNHSALNGKLRLRFRKAFGERILLHCECIFQKDQAVRNCSGFSLKAELKGQVAKRTAWTVRYSVWNWMGS